MEKNPKPAAVPAADPKPDRLTYIRTSAKKIKAADSVDPPDVELKIRNIYPSDIVPLDFTLEENKHLLEPWTKYARSHRRGPGDQAMMAVEQILTNEGLI